MRAFLSAPRRAAFRGAALRQRAVALNAREALAIQICTFSAAGRARAAAAFGQSASEQRRGATPARKISITVRDALPPPACASTVVARTRPQRARPRIFFATALRSSAAENFAEPRSSEQSRGRKHVRMAALLAREAFGRQCREALGPPVTADHVLARAVRGALRSVCEACFAAAGCPRKRAKTIPAHNLTILQREARKKIFASKNAPDSPPNPPRGADVKGV